MVYKQLPLMPEVVEEAEAGNVPLSSNGEQPYSGKDLGTFKDSLRAPVHRWFRYPAGYSYKFVEASFDIFGIRPGDWVYDPFSGSGTTLICAKQRGINGYGVEAHAFVHWVADVKLRWEYDISVLAREAERVIVESRKYVAAQLEAVNLDKVFPELVYKCYHPQDLKALYLLREYILHQVQTYEIVDLLKLALTDTLRGAAAAGTGWPYIAPNKDNGDKPPKKALIVFENVLRQMVADLRAVSKDLHTCETYNVLGDSRERQALADGQVSIAITSPPYLNNYDYADRTRLETYFWGIARSWGEITEKFRNKLIVAATTQINRNEFPDLLAVLSPDIRQAAPEVYKSLQNAVVELSGLRLHKGGKKNYDLMVALYFNDVFKVLQETYRVLKTGGHYCLVLGDSAPYGVYIPTEQVIGKLGLSLGFRHFTVHELRTRGGKWKGNPQRHKVPLKEGVLILTK